MKILLLPGLDGTGRLFRWLEIAIGDRFPFETIAYPVDGSQSHRALAESVLAKFDNEPFVVLGESFSGPVAVEVAALAGSRARGLILAGTFLTSPWPPWLLKIGAACDHRWLPDAVLKAVMLGRSARGAVADELLRLTDAVPPSVISKRLRAIATVDVRAQLAQIHCPILVLHGSHDWLVFPRPIEKAVNAAPRAVIKKLPAPHMILQLAAAEAADEIAAFVERLEGQSP